jgi:chemotaxis protein methyltransferase CheR
MSDTQCVAFLQWALPRLGMRWGGFRKVRRQVCKRAKRRANELGLPDLAAYRSYLLAHPEEWAVLEGLACITISRFYRDRGTFQFLSSAVLPALAVQVGDRGSDRLDVWSAGCASGEEPYTLAIMWELELAHRFPGLSIRILATDLHPTMLDRARRACFDAASLTDLPEHWREEAFVQHEALYWVRDRYKQAVSIAFHDIRMGLPDGPFDLVLCRNLAFTYFDTGLQRRIGGLLANALRAGGALVVGAHEQLPAGVWGFEPWAGHRTIYRRVTAQSTHSVVSDHAVFRYLPVVPRQHRE